MPWTEPPANSNELRRCIRDLVALSALPAGWQNYDMRQIGGSIVAALISMLDADFVFIALPGEGNQLISELARNKLTPKSLKHVRTILQRKTDFIGIASLNGQIQYINPAGLELVGLDALDHALRLRVLDFVSPQDRTTVQREIWPLVLRTGRWK